MAQLKTTNGTKRTLQVGAAVASVGLAVVLAVSGASSKLTETGNRIERNNEAIDRNCIAIQELRDRSAKQWEKMSRIEMLVVAIAAKQGINTATPGGGP